MKGLQHFLQLITDNWTTIVAILGLIYGIYLKAKKTYAAWNEATAEEQEKILQSEIDRVKSLLGEVVLSLVSQAEIDWHSEDGKLGAIKRSQVISQILDAYPILTNVTNQEELIAYIDELIDKALVIVREKIRDASQFVEASNQE